MCYADFMKRRSGFNASPWPALLARLLTPVLTAGLLTAAVNPHSLLHQSQSYQGQEVDPGMHGGRHPAPAHLDHSSIDVVCVACLFWFKSLNRQIMATGTVKRPQARGRLAAAAMPPRVAELSYRLPLSRAPPLS